MPLHVRRKEEAMGLFDNMFSKKNCAICGKELGVFGKTKLGDGAYLCKDCNGKLSPYFTAYGSATVDSIREQLAYREQNAANLASFNVTNTIAAGAKNVYVDEDAGNLIITTHTDWRQHNPDIIAYSQVTGCEVEVKEVRTELKRKDAEGKEVSFNPPRYDIDYDVFVHAYFDHPYFTQITWKVNGSRIETKGSTQYREAVSRAEAVRDALAGHRAEARAAAAPKQAVNCPYCCATTIPDAQGRCEYCGSALI